MGSSDFQLAPGVWLPASAIEISASRSSGPGGQNVNKVNTKATLKVSWDALAEVIPPWAIDRLKDVASRYVTVEGLTIQASDHRSLAGNRRSCQARLCAVVVEAMDRPRLRRATRPSRGAIRRRLNEKKQRGETKAGRRRVEE